MAGQLCDWVREASGRVDVTRRVAKIYRELEVEIQKRRPICIVSGRCCRFDEFGHRLFVTTMELAVFWGQLPAKLPPPLPSPGVPGEGKRSGDGAAGIAKLPPPLPSPLRSSSEPEAGVPGESKKGIPGGCPFQVGKMCGVHAIRPFGCRVFFCDSTSTDWQKQQYERFHAELKQAHLELEVPYAYREWREALAEMGML